MTRGQDEVITECQMEGIDELVPPALFEIYLRNGLVAKVGGANEFAATPLGRGRLRRR